MFVKITDTDDSDFQRRCMSFPDCKLQGNYHCSALRMIDRQYSELRQDEVLMKKINARLQPFGFAMCLLSQASEVHIRCPEEGAKLAWETFWKTFDACSLQKYMADKNRRTMKLPPRRVKTPGGNQPPWHVPVLTSVAYHGA